MATNKLFFAGSGGQGVLTMGQMVTYAAMYADMNATWLPSYGPEMRGGTANCSVILSDTPVGSPIITNPDVLVAMNLPSLQKFVDAVVPGGKIFIDSTLIDAKVERGDVEVHYIPATQLAKDAGLSTLSNMVLMGKVMKECDAVDFAGNKETLESFIPAKKANLIDANCQALQTGYDF